MRILHTSDWHLGQHFMGKTRQAEHAAFVRWLLECVETYQVDALLIAGDLFDTGTPPSYAREQYNHLVLAMRRLGCTLVVLAGNHDSPAVLGESQALLAQLGTHVIPAVGAQLDAQVLVLKQRDGAAGAVVCAIPFIRPRDLLHSQAGQSAEDKQLGLQQAIKAHYQQLFELAKQQRETLGLALPIIATGHLTTVGASASESVREIYVGSLEAFPTRDFPAADYIALGHIHRPQKVAGLEHIRYSGSPIALSFDELNQPKQVLLVDLNEQGLQQVEAVSVPCFQPLASLRGDLKQLKILIAEQAMRGSKQQPVWLDVQVSSDDYLSDLQSHVSQLCEGLPVEVLRVRRMRENTTASLQSLQSETLDELSVTEVFERRLQHESLSAEQTQQLTQLFRQVLDEVNTP